MTFKITFTGLRDFELMAHQPGASLLLLGPEDPLLPCLWRRWNTTHTSHHPTSMKVRWWGCEHLRVGPSAVVNWAHTTFKDCVTLGSRREKKQTRFLASPELNTWGLHQSKFLAEDRSEQLCYWHGALQCHHNNLSLTSQTSAFRQSLSQPENFPPSPLTFWVSVTA